MKKLLTPFNFKKTYSQSTLIFDRKGRQLGTYSDSQIYNSLVLITNEEGIGTWKHFVDCFTKEELVKNLSVKFTEEAKWNFEGSFLITKINSEAGTVDLLSIDNEVECPQIPINHIRASY